MSLTQARATIRVDGRRRRIPVAAAAKIFQGGLAMLQGGFAAPGAVAVGCLALGMAEATVDNTGGAAGALSVDIDTGVFCFDNSATDPVTTANIGSTCYIVDDHTVGATNGTNTRSPAGEVFNVDASGVWVRFL